MELGVDADYFYFCIIDNKNLLLFKYLCSISKLLKKIEFLSIPMKVIEGLFIQNILMLIKLLFKEFFDCF